MSNEITQLTLLEDVALRIFIAAPCTLSPINEDNFEECFTLAHFFLKSCKSNRV